MKNQRYSWLILILLSCSLSISTFAQISSKEVDKLVAEAMEKFEVAGTAVAIVKDGNIIHNKGYGVKSVDTKEKVDEHTQFAIASNTKAFTTAALSILIDEGKLSWQDKVVDHIPEFKMYNSYVTSNFNIQDLLTHRSGLGLGAGDLMIFPDGSDYSINDVLTCFQYFEPVSAFRTKYDYDNLLYIVAGEIIARVSGISWEDFIKTRILEPLNMDNSYSSLSQMTDKSNMAIPHSGESGPLRTIAPYDHPITGAAGGILSNVDDLSNWMILQMNKGKYGENLEKELFSERNHREMWKIHTTLPANPDRYNSHFRGYGLGWGLTDVKGNMSVSHTGGLPGMLSKTIMIPDVNLGVVVLTNTSNGGAGVFAAVTQTIIDSYLGLDDNDWIGKYYQYFQGSQSSADSVVNAVWNTVESVNTDHIKLVDYEGIYKDPWFGKVEIHQNQGELWFKSHRSPNLTGQMYYYKANAFAIKWEDRDMEADAFAIFSLDEEGVANSMTMKGISPNIDFSYDFQDLDLKRIE